MTKEYFGIDCKIVGRAELRTELGFVEASVFTHQATQFYNQAITVFNGVMFVLLLDTKPSC
jgi:hypothetical protein